MLRVTFPEWYDRLIIADQVWRLSKQQFKAGSVYQAGPRLWNMFSAVLTRAPHAFIFVCAGFGGYGSRKWRNEIEGAVGNSVR